MNAPPPVVRALDVGYSMTKYTLGNDPTQCGCFPSIAAPASDRELGVGRHGKRHTVIVPVKAQRFEVGPDARLALGTVEIRPMADDFVSTDEYLALCRGAMRFMKLDQIDLLMVGLPVSLFNTCRRVLEKRLLGLHDVGESKQVHIHRVVVLAQPMGAFLSYAVPHQQRRQMLTQRNLIIDPGGRTFDWLMTQGLKPLDQRSDSVNRGMLDVMEAIAKSVSDTLGARLTDVDRDRIDHALRHRQSVQCFGQAVDLDRHIAAGARVATQALAALRKQVQDGSDVDNIILAGGGAFFFRPHIEQAYHRHRILQVEAPLYANVRGFHIAGLELHAADARRQARRQDAAVAR